MNILAQAQALSDEIIKWRRDLHKIPEIGMVLPKTFEYVKKKLDEFNIEYTTYENHSGISAVLGKKDGKTIAIRADMDALAIKEETNLEFRSENENMHACGHDGHTAILLGIAKILKENEDELSGKVKLIFQPSEELGPGGALAMIEDGVLENPKVDAMLALHVDSKIGEYKNGDVLVRYGGMSAAEDPINIKIKGRGGHASTPNLCIDPISVATLIVNNIQYILTREIDQTMPTVISFASIQGGRGSNNIIPDIVEIKGTVRNTDNEIRKFVLQRIEEIVSGLAKIMRADFELDFYGGCPAVINDKNMVDIFIESAKKILNEDEVHILNDYNMGAEDAGFFFEKVPGCYFRIYNPAAFEDGIVYPAHNSKYMMDDSVLYRGTALMLQTAIDFLNHK
ncbi:MULTISPECIES: M20 family metallopeptidase [unclassified Clostridium]|uniref:M20 metallopeptidase family protein n=1 Tax=unclassified Clostridium TaxID=2614128 RepID=UPI00029795F1|nr:MULTISPECIES: M20 family metallopeptidase [unclassified Clostridium]EKQ58082.1 MAG: amidohydrolase [Clostridium sp. Maddingley MBC34-26]